MHVTIRNMCIYMSVLKYNVTNPKKIYEFSTESLWNLDISAYNMSPPENTTSN